MKNKAIITAGLVILALLSGCNKDQESTSKTQESTTVTTPAPTGGPAASKTQESTTTTTTDTKGQ
ncbi:MAG: hypothetical protein PHG00_15165 [Methylococcales bacterium]|nr:hypothetical protein [Methylococcales bacterium]